MAKYGRIEQELRNREKIARSMTRLKHAIAADNELNERLDEAKKQYFKKVQQGQLPEKLELDDVIGKAFDV